MLFPSRLFLLFLTLDEPAVSAELEIESVRLEPRQHVLAFLEMFGKFNQGRKDQMAVEEFLRGGIGRVAVDDLLCSGQGERDVCATGG